VEDQRRLVFEHLYLTYGLDSKLFRKILTKPNYSTVYTLVYFDIPSRLKCCCAKFWSVQELNLKNIDILDFKFRLTLLDFIYDDNQAQWVERPLGHYMDFKVILYGMQYMLIPGVSYNYTEIMELFNITPVTVDKQLFNIPFI